MYTAAQKTAQISLVYVFKHQAKEKSRLQPYGLAMVTTKQFVIPTQGSHAFT